MEIERFPSGCATFNSASRWKAGTEAPHANAPSRIILACSSHPCLVVHGLGVLELLQGIAQAQAVYYS
jgi:hypothetical protein